MNLPDLRNTALLEITVALDTTEGIKLSKFHVQSGSRILDALALPEITTWLICHGVNLTGASFGIFGKKRSLNTPIRQGDRIEVYRELECDPKEIRRQRARRK